jgi:hypothetical protein
VAGEIDIPGKPLSQVPVPAAIWLFGSGIIGLIGLARKNKEIVYRTIINGAFLNAPPANLSPNYFGFTNTTVITFVWQNQSNR